MASDRKDYYKKYNQLERTKESKREWKQKNSHLLKHRKTRRMGDEIKRVMALYFYSNGYMKCKQCEHDEINVLCLDHIDNNGAEQRKLMNGRNCAGPAFYRWIVRNNFPDNFQVLCRNCNWMKYLEFNDKLKGW